MTKHDFICTIYLFVYCLFLLPPLALSQPTTKADLLKLLPEGHLTLDLLTRYAIKGSQDLQQIRNELLTKNRI